MITLLTLLSLCVLFAPLGLVAQRSVKRLARSGWLERAHAPRELFSMLSLNEEEPDALTEASASGTIRGVPVCVRVVTNGAGSRGNLWLDIDLEGRVPKSSFVHDASSMLPSDAAPDARTRIGDEIFDRVFVTSEPVPETLSLLTEEVRGLLLSLVARDATRRWSELHVESAHLVARIALHEDDQQIKPLAAQIEDAAHAASRMIFRPDAIPNRLLEQAETKQAPLYRAQCARALLEVYPSSPQAERVVEMCRASSRCELRLIHFELEPDAFDDDARLMLLDEVSTRHGEPSRREWALDELATRYGKKLLDDRSRPMFQRILVLRAMIRAHENNPRPLALFLLGVQKRWPLAERRELWRELAELAWPSATHMLVLQEKLEVDEATLTECVRLARLVGDEHARAFLTNGLEHTLPSVRRGCIDALGEVGGREEARALHAQRKHGEVFIDAIDAALASIAARLGDSALGGLSVTHGDDEDRGELTLLDEAGGISPVEDADAAGNLSEWTPGAPEQ